MINVDKRLNLFEILKQSLKSPEFILLFIIAPLSFSSGLQDNDSSLKLIVISITTLFSYFFIRKHHRSLLGDMTMVKYNVILWLYAIYLLASLPFIFLAHSKGDAIYEAIRIGLYIIIAVSLVFRSNNNAIIPNWFYWIPISAFIFCLIGCLDLINLFRFQNDSLKNISINYSLRSSLGNKNFFAETLLLSIPFTISSFIYCSRPYKYLYGFILAITTGFIVLLNSMATYIALFIFTILLAFLLFKSNKVFRALLIIAVIAGSIIVVNKINESNVIATTQKLYSGNVDMRDFSKVSTYERLILWRNSIQMIKEYPAGAGWTNWKVLFPKYGVGSEIYMQEGSVKFINPHNDFLLLATERSIVVLILFLALSITALFKLITAGNLSESINKKFVYYSVAAGIPAYLTLMLFSYPMERTYSFLLFNCFLSFCMLHEHIALRKRKNINSCKKYKIASFIYLIMFLFSILVFSKKLKGELYIVKAMKAQKNKNWNKMESDAKEANNYFFQYDFTASPIVWYIARAKMYQKKNAEVLEHLIEAERLSPYHAHVLNDIGTVYYLSGNFQLAEMYFNKVLSLSHNFPDATINLAVIQHNKNNSDAAIALLEKLNKFSVEHQSVIKIILKDASKRWLKTSTLINDTNSIHQVNDEHFLMYVFKNSIDKKTHYYDVLNDTLIKQKIRLE